MLKRIDHVSLAVRDLEGAKRFFSILGDMVPGASGDSKSLGFSWQMFSIGDLSRFEMISPLGEKSFLNGFLAEKEGGVHHITFQTDDIEAVKRKLDENNIKWFGENEYPGGVWKEIFIHPKNAFGVLVQIAEFTARDWIHQSQKLDSGKKWEIKREDNFTTIRIEQSGGGIAELALTGEELKLLVKDLQV